MNPPYSEYYSLYASIIFWISSTSCLERCFCLVKAAIKLGREPEKVRSTTSALSADCTSSLETSDVTTAPSDFRTPRSERRLMTVYVVDFFHSSLSLHSRTNSLLVTGSFSHNISQKRYSLSNIFGISNIISTFLSCISCNKSTYTN